MTEEKKYIIFKKEVIELTRAENNDAWKDSNGTLYAFAEGKTSDPVNRCGVYPLALPTWPFFKPLNDACSPHDYAYSQESVYQAFHTRQEADEYLKHLVALSGHPILADIFYHLARWLGAPYWENDKTNV